jgi:5-methylcytosine-specific restriction protein A
LCEECKRRGVIRAAEEVDHVVALRHGGADHEGNLASTCRAHHREKTARERGDRPVLEVGVDGWPK